MYAINFLGEGYFKELRMHVVHFVQVLEFWSISSTCTKALMVTCENTWSIQLHQTITGFQDQVCMDIKFSLVTDAHHFWPTFLRKLSSSQNGTIQYLYCIALHIALHCTLHTAECSANIPMLFVLWTTLIFLLRMQIVELSFQWLEISWECEYSQALSATAVLLSWKTMYGKIIIRNF